MPANWKDPMMNEVYHRGMAAFWHYLTEGAPKWSLYAAGDEVYDSIPRRGVRTTIQEEIMREIEKDIIREGVAPRGILSWVQGGREDPTEPVHEVYIT